jgi:polar amino acid transport system substrate-binding protein
MRVHPVVTFSLLWLALAGLPTAAAAGAVEDRCERLVATGIPQYPPYLWRDPQNPQQLIGANADLLKQLAESLGLTVEVLYSGSWARAQEEVRSGRIDLLVGAFLTPQRLESMDYIHPPFYQTPSMVWVRRAADFPYAGWDDLRGHTGGTLVNNSFGAQFDTFAKANLRLEEVPLIDQAFRKLLLERTDYVLYERYPGQALVDSLGLTDELVALEPPISSEALHLTLSHNSACNEPWLRGQLAKKMLELTASGVPERLLELNVERWKAQQSTPSSAAP